MNDVIAGLDAEIIRAHAKVTIAKQRLLRAEARRLAEGFRGRRRCAHVSTGGPSDSPGGDRCCLDEGHGESMHWVRFEVFELAWSILEREGA